MFRIGSSIALKGGEVAQPDHEVATIPAVLACPVEPRLFERLLQERADRVSSEEILVRSWAIDLQRAASTAKAASSRASG
jgi:hypothetical protein